jgi:hypothetical protein
MLQTERDEVLIIVTKDATQASQWWDRPHPSIQILLLWFAVRGSRCKQYDFDYEVKCSIIIDLNFATGSRHHCYKSFACFGARPAQ